MGRFVLYISYSKPMHFFVLPSTTLSQQPTRNPFSTTFHSSMCSDTLTTPRTTIRLILASTPVQTDDPSSHFIFTPFPSPSRTRNVRREMEVKPPSMPAIEGSPMIPQKIAIDSNLEFEIQQLKAQRAESSSLN